MSGKRALTVGFLAFVAIFALDQYIKMLFVDGFRWYSDYIDLILVYNHGVAFGSFAFLAENLKYIQIALLVGVAIYVIKTRATLYAWPVGILLGAGSSNVFDRFLHGGVVDYFFYHHWFDFAVFNFADAMIDVAIVWILLLNYLATRKSEKI